MIRVIKLDENKIVIEEKHVGENYELGSNEEINNIGKIGQVKQEDGSFVTLQPKQIITQPTIEEEILYENKYQTLLLEMGVL